jgi:hypothetical protein
MKFKTLNTTIATRTAEVGITEAVTTISRIIMSREEVTIGTEQVVVGTTEKVTIFPNEIEANSLRQA